VVVASHAHVPAQVERAVRLGVPTLVVVRHPVDTVVSLVIAAPHVTLRRAFREYTHYHRALLPHRHGFVVADFDEVTTDLGGVITRVNTRFGTQFQPFDAAPAAVAEVLADIDRHHQQLHGGAEHLAPRPSERRRLEAERLRAEATAPTLDSVREPARQAYEALLPRSVA
jgi:hypothetical protein